MPLSDKAVLEIDLPDSDGTIHTGVFQLREDLTDAGELNRQYLLSNRGLYLREAYDISAGLIPDDVVEADIESMRGYHVDGGAGRWAERLTGTVGPAEDPWGDGSAAAGEYNKFDASGNVPLRAKKDVFQWYASQAAIDSRGKARLYIGEWTDGTHASTAGFHDKPMTVAIPEIQVTKNSEDPSALEVTIEAVWTATFPSDAIAETQDSLKRIGELIPEF